MNLESKSFNNFLTTKLIYIYFMFDSIVKHFDKDIYIIWFLLWQLFQATLSHELIIRVPF